MKQPRLRPAILLVLLPGLGLAGIGIVRLNQDARAWRSAIAQAGRWQADFEAVDRRRPVLWGAELEGEAWPLYERALDHVHSMREEHGLAARRIYAEDAREDPECRAFLATLDPALDDLHAGAHRSIGGMTAEWELGYRAENPLLMDARVLLIALCMNAQDELIAGRASGTVHAWLDGLQLGRDMSQSPIMVSRMIGAAGIGMVLQAIERDAAALPRESLSLLADALEHLDPLQRTRASCLSTEAILFVRYCEENRASGRGTSNDLDGMWRYGWSFPSVLDEFCAEIDAADRELAAAHAGAFPGPLQVAERVGRRFEAHANPLLKAWTKLDALVLIEAHTLTQIRMARLALAHRLERELPQLEDPWGGGYRVSETGGTLTVETSRGARELSFQLP